MAVEQQKVKTKSFKNSSALLEFIDEVRAATWQLEDIEAIYHSDFLTLVNCAANLHNEHFVPGEIQKSKLISIKTGACPEDCGYCSQSARYKTGLEKEKLMDVEAVVAGAQAAKAEGADRFCMGAAWREVKPGQDFDRVKEMVRRVKELGLETCATLGMIEQDLAEELRESGLDYYNHNIDTSPDYYSEVITTRKFTDRLNTLRNVRNAGMKVCCGGIIGMGESLTDRLNMLRELANFHPQPESVPLNLLVPVAGTPMADQKPIPPFDLVRLVATARLLMPKSYVRLSAGRNSLNHEAQALCFLAGANSIFAGDKLLTTPNVEQDDDEVLFDQLNLTPAQSNQQ